VAKTWIAATSSQLSCRHLTVAFSYRALPRKGMLTFAFRAPQTTHDPAKEMPFQIPDRHDWDD
jgi:hypothetical protein